MKVTSFNPSPIEVKVCEAIVAIQNELQTQLGDLVIEHAKSNLKKDNPDITITLKDADGDIHTLVVSFIHRPNM